MDVKAVIDKAVVGLPDGEQKRRLQYILNHIDVAIAHLTNGQDEGKTHLFTDVVYRCNQAYEGSIKEAYRSLADKDPQSKSSYQIEKYLEDKEILRPRVLDQLRRYRQEWRNPSTHDYTEDFDEDEAFLAIMSIVAFAKVCVTQIAQKAAFEAAQAVASKATTPERPTASLADTISYFAEQFFSQEVHDRFMTSTAPLPESEISAAFGGFLSIIPEAEVLLEVNVSQKSRNRADLVVNHANEHAVIELKSFRANNSLGSALNSLDQLLGQIPEASGIAILYDLDKIDYVTYDIGESRGGKPRLLIAPPTDPFDVLFERIGDG